MSTFCIFGVTQEAAKAKAMKKVSPTRPGGVMKPVHEYEQELAETAESFYANMKPIQISPAFDAPQFASQWAGIAARTVKCRDLELRARVAKKDKSDNIVKSKITGQPVMVWKPYGSDMLKAAA